MPKKLLIITYYWPPAGGPGVQRWLKFVKYLPDYDVRPVVYVPQNPEYPIVDESLRSEVPEDVTIISRPISEPYKFARLLSGKASRSISSGIVPQAKKQSLTERLMLYIRGNYFIPDARKAWVEPSVAYLSEYIKNENIETIITTGPPHSLHLIGMKLKAQLQVKWLADFRDPWTTIGYHKQLKLTKRSKLKHEHLEKQVLETADTIIVTSENTKREFEGKTDKPVVVITNGYDGHHLQNIEKDATFTMSHIGSLLSGRNPKNLWAVLSELVKEHRDFDAQFRLKLIGVVSEDVIGEIRRNGLEKHVDVLGYVEHSEALLWQRRSQLLLLTEIDSGDTKAIIPGKLFEYLISETPILAIGPRHSDVERIIQTTNTGTYFYHNATDDLKSQLLAYFEAFKNNALMVHPIGIKPYSRKELTKKLVELI